MVLNVAISYLVWFVLNMYGREPLAKASGFSSRALSYDRYEPRHEKTGF